MSAVAERVIAAFESLPSEDKRVVAKEILRRFPAAHQELGAAWRDKDLADVAADPQIQLEISRINSEFSATERE